MKNHHRLHDSNDQKHSETFKNDGLGPPQAKKIQKNVGQKSILGAAIEILPPLLGAILKQGGGGNISRISVDTQNLHKCWQKVKRCTSKFQKCAKVSANLSGPNHSKSLRCSKHDVFAATQTFGSVWITEFSEKLYTNLKFAFHFWKQY